MVIFLLFSADCIRILEELRKTSDRFSKPSDFSCWNSSISLTLRIPIGILLQFLGLQLLFYMNWFPFLDCLKKWNISYFFQFFFWYYITGNPPPGTPGGGAPPNGAPQTTLNLVPAGLNAVAVFPPFETARSLPAVAVIFSEDPSIG